MRCFILLLVLLFCTFSNKSFGQDSTVVKDFQFKDYALQFQVIDLFRINAFQGGLISFKYHLTPKTALRIGIGLNGGNSDNNEHYQREFNDSLNYNFKENDKQLGIDFITQVIFYFNPQDEIKLFAGIGPFIYMSHRDRNADDYNYSEDANFYLNRKNESTTTNIGLSAAYGLEWFFRKNMSLSAEYGFKLYCFTRDYTYHIIRIETSEEESEIRANKEDGWQFSYTVVKLGLSIYF